MSIWYAAWQAFAGTAVSLSDQLGDIRLMDDVRTNFGQAPEHFCNSCCHLMLEVATILLQTYWERPPTT
jgi:hypothetical protein